MLLSDRQAGTNWAGPVRIQIYYGDRVVPTQNIGALPLQFVGFGHKEIIIWVKYTFLGNPRFIKQDLRIHLTL